MIGLSFLIFKFRRVVYLAVALEFLVLGLALHLASTGSSISLLFFIWCRVVSSCFMLAFLVGLVKSCGRDLCYFLHRKQDLCDF